MEKTREKRSLISRKNSGKNVIAGKNVIVFREKTRKWNSSSLEEKCNRISGKNTKMEFVIAGKKM